MRRKRRLFGLSTWLFLVIQRVVLQLAIKVLHTYQNTVLVYTAFRKQGVPVVQAYRPKVCPHSNNNADGVVYSRVTYFE